MDSIELYFEVEEAELSFGLAHGVCKKAEKEDWLKEYQPCPRCQVPVQKSNGFLDVPMSNVVPDQFGTRSSQVKVSKSSSFISVKAVICQKTH